jgi:hypothetical protein
MHASLGLGEDARGVGDVKMFNAPVKSVTSPKPPPKRERGRAEWVRGSYKTYSENI